MNRGATLVELLVGLVIAAILGLTIGAVLVAATQMSLSARQPVELKGDAGFALRAIQKRVRELSPDELQVNGPGDTLTILDGSETPPYFGKVDGDLVFFDGERTVTLIEDRLGAVTFAVLEGHRAQDRMLSITLEVSDEENSIQMESLTKLRNE